MVATGSGWRLTASFSCRFFSPALKFTAVAILSLLARSSPETPLGRKCRSETCRGSRSVQAAASVPQGASFDERDVKFIEGKFLAVQAHPGPVGSYSAPTSPPAGNECD